MKYTITHRNPFITSRNLTTDNLYNAANHIQEESDFYESYNEMFDECTGDIDICGMKYTASHVLESVDPVAYRCGYSDYTDSLYSDILETLENMEDGDEEQIADFNVTCTM